MAAFGFSVYEDDENARSNFDKPMKELKEANVSSKVPLQKRAVLGLLTSNHPEFKKRIQPNRTTKQDVFDNTATSKVQLQKTQKTQEKAEPLVDRKPEAKENHYVQKRSFIPSKSPVQQSETQIEKEDEVCDEVRNLPTVHSELPALCEEPIHDVSFESKCSTPGKNGAEEEPMLEGSFIGDTPMSIEKALTPVVKKSCPSDHFLFDVSMYSSEIFSYMRQCEMKYRPKPNYMRRQPSINYSMRTILIDWLVEVAEEYTLQTQTLYMAVNYIDRFLSIMSVDRSKLQLLGTAAMFVAAKYEEVYPPDVGEFVYITDDTYSKKQVLRMEYLIVKVLTFDMSGPTIFSFISHISVICSLPERVMYLALYISELSLLEGDPYLQYIPSVIACSAIALARHCLNYTIVWTEALIHCSGYTLNDLSTCIKHLNATHSNGFTNTHKAIREKYSSDKLHNISTIPHRPLVIKNSDELSPTH